MRYILILLLIVTAAAAQDIGPIERSRIVIKNNTLRPATPKTEIDGGPAVGDMLNFHFFPGLQDYGAGQYAYAESQMSYIIRNQRFLAGNPRAAEYLSTAHYIRGMVLFYHATGIGRLSLAKADLEAAIKWNPRNHVAYLELARVYLDLEFHDQSVSILNILLDLKPDDATAGQARQMLAKAQGVPKQ